MQVAAALQTPSRIDFLALACALLAPDGLACALPVELRRMLLDAAIAEYRVVPELADLMKPVPWYRSRTAYRHSMLLDVSSLLPLIAPRFKWRSPMVVCRQRKTARECNTKPPNVVHIIFYNDHFFADGQVDRVEVDFYFGGESADGLSVVSDRLGDEEWVTYTDDSPHYCRQCLAFDAVVGLVNDVVPVLVATTVFKHGL